MVFRVIYRIKETVAVNQCDIQPFTYCIAHLHMHRQVEIAIEERHISWRIGTDIQHRFHTYTCIQAFHQAVVHREGKRELPMPVAENLLKSNHLRLKFGIIIAMHTQFIVAGRDIRIEENALVLRKNEAENQNGER